MGVLKSEVNSNWQCCRADFVPQFMQTHSGQKSALH